jgi:hypothetical protein
MTKEQLIAQYKLENPTLQRGSDETGYEEITGAEYDATIESWADAYLEKLAKKEAEELAKAEAATKRQALLDKLGITEDEARLLLGGN